MSGAVEDTAFSNAERRFRAGLTKAQLEQFAGCDKREVEETIKYIQEKYGSKKRQRNMKRVSKFIEGMSQLGQVVEVFLNVEVSVAFVWGPIKFLLQTASTWVETLNLLLDTYTEIGETLPGLARYGELFKHHPSVGEQLENYYCDILEFNKCALEVFSRPGWKTIFHSTWKTFRTNFDPILSRFRRHKTLLSEEKLTALVSEVQSNFQQLRNDISSRDAQDQARILAGVEEIRRQQRRALREDLDAPDSHQDQEHSFAVLRSSSSGNWIASEPTLKTWSDPLSTKSLFLFLSGIPGAGKTTLTSGVVNHLLELQQKEELRGNKIGVAYFYFKHTHEDKRSLQKMMRSVLSQLIEQDPSLLDHVYREVCGTSRISFDQVKQLAQLAISSSRLCFLVVDGLDECSKDKILRTTEAEKVIKWLIELTTSPDAQSSDIRVLVSSQRDGVIEEMLGDYPTLQLENMQLHDDDIGRYVRAQARVISETFRGTQATVDEIVEKIIATAKGMFLYAKVVLDNLLEQETASDFAAELKEENFPGGLEDAYERIVRRVLKTSGESKRRFAQKILGYVVCAHRPLRWREIQNLFCIDPKAGTVDLNCSPLRSCKYFCSSLVDAVGCKGDAYDPEGRVELVHVSAKRYLINTESVCLATEHARMALFTSRYLSAKPFDLKMFEEIQSCALSGFYNLHDYAVTSWWHHTHEAIQDDSSPCLEIFLDMVESISGYLESHLEVESCGSMSSTTSGGTLARFRQLRTDVRARQDLGTLSTRIVAIREVIETTWVHMPHNPKIHDSIGLRMYGPKQYKCSKTWCHRFSDGFQDSRQRDDHMNQHDRPFRCSVDGCFAGALGFPSEQQLQQHIDRHHQEPEKMKFSIVGQSRKYQDVAAAICAEDLEAVKVMVQKCIDETGTFDFAQSTSRRKSWSALTLAIQRQHFGICQYLLEKGAPPFSQEVQMAINKDDAEIVRLLISNIPPAQVDIVAHEIILAAGPRMAGIDAQRTFLDAFELYHPRFILSDVCVQNAIKRGLLEVVKRCLTRENDMVRQRLETDYDSWMDPIMQTSQECFQLILFHDTSGMVTYQIVLEAYSRGDEDILSRFPNFTTKFLKSICEIYRGSLAGHDSQHLQSEFESMMWMILKQDAKNIWDILGVSFCFVPLDSRLHMMDRNMLRKALSADDSLFIQQDKEGAALLHGFVHSYDVDMVEFSASRASASGSLCFRIGWGEPGNDHGTSPIKFALGGIRDGGYNINGGWVKIVYLLLSTGRVDFSEIDDGEKLACCIAAGKNFAWMPFELIAKALSHLCPTATEGEISRLVTQLPLLASDLEAIWSSNPDVEEPKRNFSLEKLIANPDLHSWLGR